MDADEALESITNASKLLRDKVISVSGGVMTAYYDRQKSHHHERRLDGCRNCGDVIGLVCIICGDVNMPEMMIDSACICGNRQSSLSVNLTPGALDVRTEE